MIYSTSEIKKQDNILPESESLELLKNGEYGVLSMYCGEQGAYGVPLNFVWDGKNSIYIHCAAEGKKLQCVDNFASVSFCVVGKTTVVPAGFTAEYESIIMQCRAFRNLPKDEAMNALMMLIEKYSPNHKAGGKKYAEKFFHETEVIRLHVEQWSGKANKAG
jgi:nitroimidazol reductase NimA-like FMN-containing flavoprotein (pyridoxamine 5'-phosphate oxidase superfamily)